MKFPFTDARVRNLKAQATRYAVQDENKPGLFVRVTPAGTKTFWLSVWFNGKRTWLRIGGFPQMTVEQARAEFDLQRASMGANGEAARRAVPHVTPLDRVWWLYKQSNPDNLCATTMRNRAYHYDRHISPALGRCPVSQIRRSQVEQLKDSLQAQCYSARTINETLIVLQLLFKHAVRWEYMPDNAPIPTAGVRRAKATPSRSRRLRGDEYTRFLQAVDEFAVVKRPEYTTGYRQTVADAIKVMLFTGARSANVKQMRWCDLSQDLKLWTIPAAMTKTGREYTIPVTSQVEEILRRRLRGAKGSPEFVFPGRGKDPHLTSIRSSWAQILRTAGLENLTPHDLRRTQGSVQADLGVNMALIGEALCHTDIKSTAVYTRGSGIDQVRENMERANREMTGPGPRADAKAQAEALLAQVTDESLRANLRAFIATLAA